jgi:hypothetical protein
MENFTMMLGYDPKVNIYTSFSKNQSITQFCSRKPKKIIRLSFKRFVPFTYWIQKLF